MKERRREKVRDKIKDKLLRKEAGISDMIYSLIVITALAVFILFFIGVIGDIDTRTQIDQVARKYILRMESSGELTNSEKQAIIDDLNKIRAVKLATSKGYNIDVSYNQGAGPKGYGHTITLDIKCPAMTTTYDGHNVVNSATGQQGRYNMFGVIRRNKVQTFYITKQSTAKF